MESHRTKSRRRNKVENLKAELSKKEDESKGPETSKTIKNHKTDVKEVLNNKLKLKEQKKIELNVTSINNKKKDIDYSVRKKFAKRSKEVTDDKWNSMPSTSNINLSAEVKKEDESNMTEISKTSLKNPYTSTDMPEVQIEEDLNRAKIQETSVSDWLWFLLFSVFSQIVEKIFFFNFFNDNRKDEASTSRNERDNSMDQTKLLSENDSQNNKISKITNLLPEDQNENARNATEIEETFLENEGFKLSNEMAEIPISQTSSNDSLKNENIASGIFVKEFQRGNECNKIVNSKTSSNTEDIVESYTSSRNVSAHKVEFTVDECNSMPSTLILSSTPNKNLTEDVPKGNKILRTETSDTSYKNDKNDEANTSIAIVPEIQIKGDSNEVKIQEPSFNDSQSDEASSSNNVVLENQECGENTMAQINKLPENDSYNNQISTVTNILLEEHNVKANNATEIQETSLNYKDLNSSIEMAQIQKENESIETQIIQTNDFNKNKNIATGITVPEFQLEIEHLKIVKSKRSCNNKNTIEPSTSSKNESEYQEEENSMKQLSCLSYEVSSNDEANISDNKELKVCEDFQTFNSKISKKNNENINAENVSYTNLVVQKEIELSKTSTINSNENEKEDYLFKNTSGINYSELTFDECNSIPSTSNSTSTPNKHLTEDILKEDKRNRMEISDTSYKNSHTDGAYTSIAIVPEVHIEEDSHKVNTQEPYSNDSQNVEASSSNIKVLENEECGESITELINMLSVINDIRGNIISTITNMILEEQNEKVSNETEMKEISSDFEEFKSSIETGEANTSIVPEVQIEECSNKVKIQEPTSYDSQNDEASWSNKECGEKAMDQINKISKNDSHNNKIKISTKTNIILKKQNEKVGDEMKMKQTSLGYEDLHSSIEVAQIQKENQSIETQIRHTNDSINNKNIASGITVPENKCRKMVKSKTFKNNKDIIEASITSKNVSAYQEEETSIKQWQGLSYEVSGNDEASISDNKEPIINKDFQSLKSKIMEKENENNDEEKVSNTNQVLQKEVELSETSTINNNENEDYILKNKSGKKNFELTVDKCNSKPSTSVPTSTPNKTLIEDVPKEDKRDRTEISETSFKNSHTDKANTLIAVVPEVQIEEDSNKVNTQEPNSNVSQNDEASLSNNIVLENEDCGESFTELINKLSENENHNNNISTITNMILKEQNEKVSIETEMKETLLDYEDLHSSFETGEADTSIAIVPEVQIEEYSNKVKIQEPTSYDSQNDEASSSNNLVLKNQECGESAMEQISESSENDSHDYKIFTKTNKLLEKQNKKVSNETKMKETSLDYEDLNSSIEMAQIQKENQYFVTQKGQTNDSLNNKNIASGITKPEFQRENECHKMIKSKTSGNNKDIIEASTLSRNMSAYQEEEISIKPWQGITYEVSGNDEASISDNEELIVSKDFQSLESKINEKENENNYVEKVSNTNQVLQKEVEISETSTINNNENENEDYLLENTSGIKYFELTVDECNSMPSTLIPTSTPNKNLTEDVPKKDESNRTEISETSFKNSHTDKANTSIAIVPKVLIEEYSNKVKIQEPSSYDSQNDDEASSSNNLVLKNQESENTMGPVKDPSNNDSHRNKMSTLTTIPLNYQHEKASKASKVRTEIKETFTDYENFELYNEMTQSHKGIQCNETQSIQTSSDDGINNSISIFLEINKLLLLLLLENVSNTSSVPVTQKEDKYPKFVINKTSGNERDINESSTSSTNLSKCQDEESSMNQMTCLSCNSSSQASLSFNNKSNVSTEFDIIKTELNKSKKEDKNKEINGTKINNTIENYDNDDKKEPKLQKDLQLNKKSNNNDNNTVNYLLKTPIAENYRDITDEECNSMLSTLILTLPPKKNHSNDYKKVSNNNQELEVGKELELSYTSNNKENDNEEVTVDDCNSMPSTSIFTFNTNRTLTAKVLNKDESNIKEISDTSCKNRHKYEPCTSNDIVPEVELKEDSNKKKKQESFSNENRIKKASTSSKIISENEEYGKSATEQISNNDSHNYNISTFTNTLSKYQHKKTTFKMEIKETCLDYKDQLHKDSTSSNTVKVQDESESTEIRPESNSYIFFKTLVTQIKSEEEKTYNDSNDSDDSLIGNLIAEVCMDIENRIGLKVSVASYNDNDDDEISPSRNTSAVHHKEKKQNNTKDIRKRPFKVINDVSIEDQDEVKEERRNTKVKRSRNGVTKIESFTFNSNEKEKEKIEIDLNYSDDDEAYSSKKLTSEEVRKLRMKNFKEMMANVLKELRKRKRKRLEDLLRNISVEENDR